MLDPYPGRRPAEESSVELDGLSEETIERLRAVRAGYRLGRYSEETQESKRLLFARWLYEHGRIQP